MYHFEASPVWHLRDSQRAAPFSSRQRGLQYLENLFTVCVNLVVLQYLHELSSPFDWAVLCQHVQHGEAMGVLYVKCYRYRLLAYGVWISFRPECGNGFSNC